MVIKTLLLILALAIIIRGLLEIAAECLIAHIEGKGHDGL